MLLGISKVFPKANVQWLLTGIGDPINQVVAEKRQKRMEKRLETL